MVWPDKFFPGIIQSIIIAFLVVSPQIAYAQQIDLRLELIPPTQKLIGDGRSQYPLTFLILDPEGNLREGQSLKVESEIGSLSSPEEFTPGFYTTIFTPPVLAITTRVKIDVWARAVSGSIAKVYILPVYPEEGLRISASSETETILLGKQMHGELSLRITDPLGKPVVGAELKLSPTVGKVDKIRELGQGDYAATYIPPPQRYPQVALVFIRAQLKNEVGLGWLVILLVGSTVVPAETDPDTQVIIRVGEKNFGPFDSGSEGKFDAPLVVPPGHKYALGIVTDSFGNITKKSIDLKVPPFNRLKMEADTDTLVADGRSKARIRIFVVDKFGAPKKGGMINLSATQGTLSPIVEEREGLYSAELTAPARVTTGGRILIDASLPEDEVSQDRVELKLRAGNYPALLTMGTEPRRLIADGRSQAKISLRLEDVWGNGLSGRSIELRADTGVLSKMVDQGRGDYFAVLRSPRELGKKSFINLSASVIVKLNPPHPEFTLKREAKIYLSAGKPEKAILTVTPGVLPADGKSSSLINIKVFDAYGNPISGERLVVTASLGQLGEIKELGNGSYSLKYVSSKERAGGKSEITVTNPQKDFTGATNILLMPMPRNFGIGPKIGYVTNFGSISGIYPGIEGSYVLPWMNRSLSIALEAGYYSSSDEESGQDAAGDYKIGIDLKVIPISLSGVYRIPYGRFRPYAGLGLGALVADSKISYSRQPALSSSSAVFGVHGLGGLELKLGPGSALVELKYNYSRLDTRLEASSSALEGNIGGLTAGVGYRFMF
jgi:opacity protein-like surface antigen